MLIASSGRESLAVLGKKLRALANKVGGLVPLTLTLSHPQNSRSQDLFSCSFSDSLSFTLSLSQTLSHPFARSHSRSLSRPLLQLSSLALNNRLFTPRWMSDPKRSQPQTYKHT